ncbi:MAG TPA: hypothetical protein VF905_09025 [Nitrospirota bacterium]
MINGIGHRIVKKYKGTSLIEFAHGPECEGVCNLIISGRNQPWVTYEQVTGNLVCTHCGAKSLLPTPAVLKKGLAYLDLVAIAPELEDFRLRHSECPEPPPLQPSSASSEEA